MDAAQLHVTERTRVDEVEPARAESTAAATASVTPNSARSSVVKKTALLMTYGMSKSTAEATAPNASFDKRVTTRHNATAAASPNSEESKRNSRSLAPRR